MIHDEPPRARREVMAHCEDGVWRKCLIHFSGNGPLTGAMGRRFVASVGVDLHRINGEAVPLPNTMIDAVYFRANDMDPWRHLIPRNVEEKLDKVHG